MLSRSFLISLCLIMACERFALAQLSTTPPSTAPSVATGDLNKSRTPHRKPAPGVIEEMTTKELGNFDYDSEKGGTIPADVTALDGTTLRLRGYMIPMDQVEKITMFALVDDLTSRGAPPVQQVVVVNMPKGQPTNYLPDLITVEGRLHVRVQKDQGDIISIFDLDATSVRTATPDASHAPSSQPH